MSHVGRIGPPRLLDHLRRHVHTDHTAPAKQVKQSRFSQMWRPPSLCVFPYVSGFIRFESNNGSGRVSQWRVAYMGDMTERWGAELWGTELWGRELWGAELWGAELWGAELRGRELWGAELWEGKRAYGRRAAPRGCNRSPHPSRGRRQCGRGCSQMQGDTISRRRRIRVSCFERPRGKRCHARVCGRSGAKICTRACVRVRWRDRCRERWREKSRSQKVSRACVCVCELRIQSTVPKRDLKKEGA